MKVCRSERCPRCGQRVPTGQTDSIRVLDKEEFKGASIALHRVRRKKCHNCGLEGAQTMFIGGTVWTLPDSGEIFHP